MLFASMGLGDAERAAASFTEHDVDGDGSIDKGGLCWPGAPACWVLRLDDANALGEFLRLLLAERVLDDARPQRGIW